MPQPMTLCFVVESGTDVRLVDGLAARSSLTVLAREIRGGVAVSRQPGEAADVRIGPAGRLSFSSWAARQVASGAWDHVIVQGYGLAALRAARRARRLGISVSSLVCSPVESYYRCRLVNPVRGKPYSTLGRIGIAVVARLTARAVGRHVVLSEYLAGVVRRHRRRAMVHVIPVYGVDTRRFTPASEPRDALRRRLRLPEDGALLFFSSRVAPEKDAVTVLYALALLVRRGRDVRLLHRSGGYRELADMAASLGVADRIIATDAVHPERELPDSYRASDVCIQASLDEGLGFSPLEALACGTPVVASSVGGLRETVVDGQTGWSVPPRDPEALARAIEEVLDDPAEAARRAAMGRQMVVDRYERRLVFDHLFQVLASGRDARR